MVIGQLRWGVPENVCQHVVVLVYHQGIVEGFSVLGEPGVVQALLGRGSLVRLRGHHQLQNVDTLSGDMPRQLILDRRYWICVFIILKDLLGAGALI